MRRVLPGLILVVLAVACRPPEREAPKTDTGKVAVPGAAAAPAGAAGRQLTDGERAAMLAALGNAQPGGHKVWFAVTQSDAEAVALKNAFEAVFKQAGWATETQPISGMVLKPGLSFLVAGEETPPYVASAQQALEATSFEFKAGTGYGAYYAERKKNDPNWPGLPLVAGQDFVVVIGPRPPAS